MTALAARRAAATGASPAAERVYLTSFAITNVGVGAFVLAMGLAMYDATGAATAFGVLVGLEFLLGLVGQAVGGSILDRHDVLRIGVYSNGARGVVLVAAGLASAAVGGVGWLVLAFVVSSVIRPLYRSTSFALVPRVTTRDRLVRLNGLRFGLLQVAQMAGSLLVSALSALIAPTLILVVVGALFVAASALLARLRGLAVPTAPVEGAVAGTSIATAWQELGRVLRRSPPGLIHLVLGCAGPMLVALASILVVPLDARLGGGAIGLGTISAGETLGALVVTLVVVRRTPAARLTRNVGVALAMAPVAVAAMTMPGGVAVATVAYVFLGGVAALAGAGLDSLLQLRTHATLVGRLAISQEVTVSVVSAVLLPLSGAAVAHIGFHRAGLLFTGVTALFPLLFVIGVARYRGALLSRPLADVTA